MGNSSYMYMLCINARYVHAGVAVPDDASAKIDERSHIQQKVKETVRGMDTLRVESTRRSQLDSVSIDSNEAE